MCASLRNSFLIRPITLQILRKHLISITSTCVSSSAYPNIRSACHRCYLIFFLRLFVDCSDLLLPHGSGVKLTNFSIFPGRQEEERLQEGKDQLPQPRAPQEQEEVISWLIIKDINVSILFDLTCDLKSLRVRNVGQLTYVLRCKCTFGQENDTTRHIVVFVPVGVIFNSIDFFIF